MKVGKLKLSVQYSLKKIWRLAVMLGVWQELMCSVCFKLIYSSVQPPLYT